MNEKDKAKERHRDMVIGTNKKECKIDLKGKRQWKKKRDKPTKRRRERET